MSSKGRKSAEYKVGYCRPPIATRFAVGNRANPKGRPKGSRSVSAILEDIIRQTVPVSEHGATRRIPRLEVILLQLANDAMRRDLPAVKLFISLVDRYVSAPAPAHRLDDLLAEDRTILARYLPDPAPSEPSNPNKAEDDDER